MKERAPSDASEKEQQELAEELLREDAELGRLWERLQELVRANDESVLLTLRAIDRDEKEKGKEDSGA